MDSAPLLGSWARAGDLVGLVAAVDDDTVTVFNPGDRQVARVPLAEAEALPAGTIRVEVAVDLPVPHGFEEASLRRWVAALADPVLRERGRDATREAGLDEAALLPEPRMQVVRPQQSGAVCLAGHRVPAPDGAALTCPSCGRLAAARPTSTGGTVAT